MFHVIDAKKGSENRDFSTGLYFCARIVGIVSDWLKKRNDFCCFSTTFDASSYLVFQNPNFVSNASTSPCELFSLSSSSKGPLRLVSLA